MIAFRQVNVDSTVVLKAREILIEKFPFLTCLACSNKEIKDCPQDAFVW
jgi:hypothetical protein